MKTTINKKLQEYCVSERKKRKTLHYNYGTVCVGVTAGRYQVCSHSFKNDSSYIYLPNLCDKLNKIGKIGHCCNGNCVLGYCAEPHAANILLSRLNTNHHKRNIIQDTSKFIFTQALRIRTGQQVKYCSFCKQTFPQL